MKMNWKRTLLASLVSVPLLCGAAEAWTFAEMPHRTALEWNPGEGSACECAIDFEILSRLAKREIPAEMSSIRLAARTPKGETPLPFSLTGREGKILHIRFILPEKSTGAVLYFGGKGTPEKAAPESGNLIAGALSPKNWKPVRGKWNLRAQNGGLLFHAPQFGSWIIERTFPLPADTMPGAPVVLDFGLRSLCGFPWNFSLRVRQLDAAGKILPSSAADPRWSTFYLPSGKTVANRVFGHLDPRAKAVRLEWKATIPYSRFDNDGKEAPEYRKEGMRVLLTRLQLRTAQKIPFPGRNPACFTEGVDGGRAFRLDGRRAPFFNANPPCVWSEGEEKLTAQTEYHWSRGDGTFEAWIKPEFTSADRENTLVDVYQNYRRNLLTLTYRPKEKHLILKMKDFGDRETTLSANAGLPAGKWSHIAVCWSRKEGIALFLDGKKIGADPAFRFQAAALEKAERCDSIMPDNISLGIAAKPVRSMPADLRPEQFLKGALDKVRFSVGARYSGNFEPEKDLRNDERTCAFFDYETSFDGVHGAGDRFIAGSVLSLDSPYADAMKVETRNRDRISVETVRVFPSEVPPENRPSHTLPVCNYPEMPSVEDFHAARRTEVRTFSVKTGDRIRISLPEKGYMNWLEIACPENGSSLVGPVLLNRGDVDVRSYSRIAATLFPPEDGKLTDHQRAIRMFSFMIRSSDYFMSHQARIDEQNTLQGAEYGGLSQMISYCGFECGPLNTLTMNMFVRVLGLPACMTHGNFHLFEQVFYDGRWRLFDLSARTYFPSRRKTDAASLEEIEEDPALLGRNNGYHFYRLCAREASPWGISQEERQSYTLRPGESFRIHWQNNGEYNDLQRYQPRLRRSMRESGRDVTAETGVGKVRSGESVRQFDRPFPHYSSAFLRFRGNVSAANPAFSNVSGRSFTYRVKLPYPIVSATFRSGGKNLRGELSYDNGKTWRSVPVADDGLCRLTLEVRARNSFLFRVSGEIDGTFQAETCVQMNPRVLTGALLRGENDIAFRSDRPGNAKITYSWRMDDGEIVLNNVLSWGAIPGEEKQMVPLNLETPYAISVSGLGADAELICSEGIRAERNGNTIRLSATDPKERLGSVTIRDGKREKHLVVAVLPGSRWIPAEKMRFRTGMELLPPDETRTMTVLRSKRAGMDVVWPFDPVRPGKYMVFHLGRNPRRTHLINLVRLLRNGKLGPVLVHKTNNAAEFYKVEQQLWRFRWDYTISGVYPYQMMQPLELPACDSLKVRYMCPDIESAGVLLIPADNPEFLSLFRKYCCGFNYQPQMFADR